MATILLRANTTTGTPQNAPAAAAATMKEPLLAFGGFNSGGNLQAYTGGYDLIVSTGASGFAPLISPLRQVEMIGNQSIGGRKTFGLANIAISGGTPTQVLTTDGSGNLSWTTVTSGGNYTFGRGLTDTAGTIDLDVAGASAAALGGVFVAGAGPTGINLAGNGALSLVPAGTAQIGGVIVNPNTGLTMTGSVLFIDPATPAIATAGTDAIRPITAQVLQLGAAPGTLTTAAKTLVPAINELQAQIDALAGVQILVGTYNVATNALTPVANSPASAGALPPANVASQGWYVIVDVAGVGSGNAPAQPIGVGDWLVSTGTAWLHFDMHLDQLTAINVAITPIPNLVATNVQAALAALQADKLGPLLTDASLAGDGQTTALAVAVVDGGTF